MQNSLINLGLIVSNLKRFWPLWLIYLVVMALLFVAPTCSVLLNAAIDPVDVRDEAVAALWDIARLQCLPFAFCASIIVAVSLNEHLFNRKAATFYGSLPLRRNTLFATNYLAGFIGLVAVSAVVALVLLAVHLVNPLLTVSMAGEWFALMLALTFVFYSLAQLVCQLAGTRPVAIVLYFVLNVLAACLEGAILLIVMVLQYGIGGWELHAVWASPLIGLGYYGVGFALASLSSVSWPVIAGYCIAAVAFIAAAVVLNNRRDLEVAGNAVAYDWLAPVLKYLAGISMALLFAAIGCVFFWPGNINGVPLNLANAIALFVAMAVGGFVGLVLADLVMRRKDSAVRRCWKGGLVLAGASLLFVGCCYFDVFGIANRVPAPSEVRSVQIMCAGKDLGTLTSDKDKEKVAAIHREILDIGRRSAESGQDVVRGRYQANSEIVSMHYTLEDGSTILRQYPLAVVVDDEGYLDEGSDGAAVLFEIAGLVNSDQALRSRFADVLDPENDAIDFTFTFVGEEKEDGSVQSATLSKKQKADLIEHALTADLLEEHAADFDPRQLWGAEGTADLDVVLEISDGDFGRHHLTLWLNPEKTPNTVAWVKKNLPAMLES